MARVTIKATDAGFHNSVLSGELLAPNIFLKTATNWFGNIFGSGDKWKTLESIFHKNFGVNIDAKSSLPETAELGSTAEIMITEITYYRLENGEKIVFGTMTLPKPMPVIVTFDEIANGEKVWTADIGNILETEINDNGFEFIGDEGDDVFAPHTNTTGSHVINIILGKGGNDHLTGSGGDDLIKGGTGADWIFDPDGKNELIGGNGDDYIKVGHGSDGSELIGGMGHDTLISGNGNDHLDGRSGCDVIYGYGGNDTLMGRMGRDELHGGTGNDIINGGRGHDTLSGGDDEDIFVFNPEDNGNDIITDFDDGYDLIRFERGVHFSDLTIEQVGKDTLIYWGNDTASILVENITATDLTSDDFIFG